MKKLMCVVLMLCACMAVTASKNNQPKPTKKIVVSRFEAAEAAVKKALESMPAELKDGKKYQKLGWDDKMQPAEQFLYQEEMITPKEGLDAKSHKLKDVYDKIRKNQAPTSLIMHHKFGKPSYKKKGTGKKKTEEVDSNIIVVPVFVEAHTVAKDNKSDVRYKATLTFEVKVQDKKDKNNRDKAYDIHYYNAKENAKLVSSADAKAITFLSSEEEAMKTAAVKAITAWYAGLPSNLDEQYAAQAVGEMTLSNDKVTVNQPNKQKVITSKQVRDITIPVDPYTMIKENERHLYTDPEASIVVTPKFTVSVDKSMKGKIDKVTYEKVKTIKPVTDSVKSARNAKAKEVVANLSAKMADYVSTGDKAKKEEISKLFANNNSKVEVSHKSKHGKERIKTNKAANYLKQLKGTNLDINADEIVVTPETSDWSSLVCTISQDFAGKSYSDNTTKKIYLTYDPDTDSFRISKIEVVPNSTILK